LIKGATVRQVGQYEVVQRVRRGVREEEERSW
jgi:hypothetical protein